MTFKNNFICHFCGITKDGIDPNAGSWWHLTAHRGHYTGLACPSCYDVIEAKTDQQIHDEAIAGAVASKLAPALSLKDVLES